MSLSRAARPISGSPQRARSELRALLASSGWPGDAEAAVLAFHEALANAYYHGGGVRQVTAAIRGTVLEVEVCDNGRGFAFGGRDERPDPLAERGRGLWLISRLADTWDVSTTADGSCLRLRFLP